MEKSKSKRKVYYESENSQSDHNFEENVNQFVRYVIYKAGSNLPIRKNDILKNVLPNIGRHYQKVVTKATNILKSVYGYDLILCEQPVSNKQYIVINLLPYKKLIDDDEDDEKARKNLMMLALTHVFMEDNSVGEDSLFKFLKSLEIDIDSKDAVFGDVREIIQRMVHQKYLAINVDQNTRKSIFSWGEKAEIAISKRKILEFVSSIYGNCQPEAFEKQYKLITEQLDEESEEMDID